jgi:hypothetical protein
MGLLHTVSTESCQVLPLQFDHLHEFSPPVLPETQNLPQGGCNQPQQAAAPLHRNPLQNRAIAKAPLSFQHYQNMDSILYSSPSCTPHDWQVLPTLCRPHTRSLLVALREQWLQD